MKKMLVFFSIIILFLLSGCSSYRNEYDELYNQYLDLQIKYEKTFSEHYSGENVGAYLDGILDKLSSLEDDMSAVYCYFADDSSTFDEASAAIENINAVYSSIIYPDHRK